MCPVFYGASFIALSKPDDGVRPIAMGLTLRRLAGKVVMSKVRHVCDEVFSPHQLGVVTHRGAEIAIHALRRYVRSNINEGKVVLKLDFSNACNSMRRDKILNKINEHIPGLYPMIWQAYAEASNLYFSNGYVKA